MARHLTCLCILHVQEDQPRPEILAELEAQDSAHPEDLLRPLTGSHYSGYSSCQLSARDSFNL